MANRPELSREPTMVIIELSCAEAWRGISEMLDGTLDPPMRARMELHLRACAHCTAVYDGTRNTVHLLGDHRIFPLPEGFADRLWQRLATDLC